MTISCFSIEASLYGVVYLLGSLLFFLSEKKGKRFTLDNLLVVSMATIGAICGGRVFYVLVYEPSYYLNHLSEIPQIYKGGMSFHGGVLGVVATLYIVDRKFFLERLDAVCKCALIIIPLGRIANFINGELFGRMTDLPFAIVFEGADQFPRHPSQLYEAVAEGPVILLLMYLLSGKDVFRTTIPGLFAARYMIFYCILRFFIEFTRQPDAFLGFIGPGEFLTLGQVLCLLFLTATLLFERRLKHQMRKPS
ncbi:MAG: prolipoprotein diacylglyceryl transferase [Succinivibrio sp.]